MHIPTWIIQEGSDGTLTDLGPAIVRYQMPMYREGEKFEEYRGRLHFAFDGDVKLSVTLDDSDFDSERNLITPLVMRDPELGTIRYFWGAALANLLRTRGSLDGIEQGRPIVKKRPDAIPV